MKKLILLLALAAMFTACKKKQCWQCVTTISYTPSSSMPSSTTRSSICDQTADDIGNIIKQSTTTSTSGSVTVRQIMSCSPE